MSTQYPRLEARVSAQERLMTILHGRIEELSQDMDESFKQLAQYHIATENTLNARFDKIESQLATMATKEDVAALETRIDKQMTDMEGRILGAFQQLIAMIDSRLPPQ